MFLLNIEKKGKFISFLKVKSKPMAPRKPKATFKLQTTLQSFKRLKVQTGLDQNCKVDKYGNVSFPDGRGPPPM